MCKANLLTAHDVHVSPKQNYDLSRPPSGLLPCNIIIDMFVLFGG